MGIAENNTSLTVGNMTNSRLSQKYSDKGKWFGDSQHTTYIKCTMDSFLDFLTDIFKGDRQRARETEKQFHRASLGEFIENKLYDFNL